MFSFLQNLKLKTEVIIDYFWLTELNQLGVIWLLHCRKGILQKLQYV